LIYISAVVIIENIIDEDRISMGDWNDVLVANHPPFFPEEWERICSPPAQ
jgi:hypothetical protein